MHNTITYSYIKHTINEQQSPIQHSADFTEMGMNNGSPKELLSLVENPLVFDDILPRSPLFSSSRNTEYGAPTTPGDFEFSLGKRPALTEMENIEEQGSLNNNIIEMDTENPVPVTQPPVETMSGVNAASDANVQPRSELNQPPNDDAPRSNVSHQSEPSFKYPSVSPVMYPHCHVSYSRAYSIRRHIRTVHSGAQNFQCHYCSAHFRTSRQVRMHESAVHGSVVSTRKWKCRHCERVFHDGKGALNKHVATAHASVWCTKCSVGFTTQAYLRRHDIAFHGRLGTENDTVDSMEINGADRRQKYTQTELPGIERKDPNTSEREDVTFSNFEQASQRAGSSSQHAMRRGAISAMAVNPFNILDTQEERTNEQEGRLQEINDASAANSISNVTEKTGKGPVTLIGSMRDETQWILCPTCNVRLSDTNALESHTGKYHSEYQHIRSMVRPSAFNEPHHLPLHMKTLHRNEPSSLAVTCQMCGASVCERGKLKRHIMRCHTGEQPHSCDLCTARFRTLRQLRMHKRALHYIE